MFRTQFPLSNIGSTPFLVRRSRARSPALATLFLFFLLASASAFGLVAGTKSRRTSVPESSLGRNNLPTTAGKARIGDGTSAALLRDLLAARSGAAVVVADALRAGADAAERAIWTARPTKVIALNFMDGADPLEVDASRTYAQMLLQGVAVPPGAGFVAKREVWFLDPFCPN